MVVSENIGGRMKIEKINKIFSERRVIGFCLFLLILAFLVGCANVDKSELKQTKDELVQTYTRIESLQVDVIKMENIVQRIVLGTDIIFMDCNDRLFIGAMNRNNRSYDTEGFCVGDFANKTMLYDCGYDTEDSLILGFDCYPIVELPLGWESYSLKKSVEYCKETYPTCEVRINNQGRLVVFGKDLTGDSAIWIEGIGGV